MAAYWMTFRNHSAGCVEGDDKDDAIRNAEIVVEETPLTADCLPYPASPRLFAKTVRGSDGSYRVIPSFCMHPEQCKGRGCCPRRMSCVD